MLRQQNASSTALCLHACLAPSRGANPYNQRRRFWTRRRKQIGIATGWTLVAVLTTRLLFGVGVFLGERLGDVIGGGTDGGGADDADDDDVGPWGPQITGDFRRVLTPELKPGEAETLKWEDGSVVQPYATRVGLPPQLVPAITEYAKEMGLYDIMLNKLYDDPLDVGGVSEFYTFQSPYQKGADAGEIRNFTWDAERPQRKWFSDAHWFNTADELAHEDVLRLLAKEGFDQVLKGIGELYGLETLNVDGFGFIATTYCDGGYFHTDFKDVGGGGFNLLFEIQSPDETSWWGSKKSSPDIILEGDNGIKAEMHYSKTVAWANGDGTRHATNIVDHRPHRGVRISCTIFINDISKDNIDNLSYGTTSIFPGATWQKAWMWSQRGRHWRKGGGPSLINDRGRAAFEVEDTDSNCAEVNCNDPDLRAGCMKTCNVFLDDDNDYQQGLYRQTYFGY